MKVVASRIDLQLRVITNGSLPGEGHRRHANSRWLQNNKPCRMVVAHVERGLKRNRILGRMRSAVC